MITLFTLNKINVHWFYIYNFTIKMYLIFFSTIFIKINKKDNRLKEVD